MSRVAQAVLGGETNGQKVGDVYAGHAPEGFMDPTDSWDTLGTRVVAARGSSSKREGGAVSHSTLQS